MFLHDGNFQRKLQVPVQPICMFMDYVKAGSRVTDFIKNPLDCGHQYEQVTARNLELFIDVECMIALVLENTIALWKQFSVNRVASSAALSAAFDEFGFIPLVSLFLLPFAFAIPPTRTIRYLAGTVLNCANWPCGIFMQHRFYDATLHEMVLFIIDDIATELAVKKQNLLSIVLSMKGLYVVDCSFVGPLKLSTLLLEVIARQFCFCSLATSHRAMEVITIAGELCIWIRPTLPSQLSLAVPIISQLNSNFYLHFCI